jgi:hypothetical protein
MSKLPAPNIQFNNDKISENQKIANLMALELTEYFFDLITDENVHIDVFIKEFKDNLSLLLHSILDTQPNHIVLSNIANYYTVIAGRINGKKGIDLDQKPEAIQVLKMPKNITSDVVEKILDLFFYQKNFNDKIVKVVKNDWEVLIMPLSTLESLK